MVPIILGELANGVLVQYENLKMCAYNTYLLAVHLNSNTGKIQKNIMQKMSLFIYNPVSLYNSSQVTLATMGHGSI